MNNLILLHMHLVFPATGFRIFEGRITVAFSECGVVRQNGLNQESYYNLPVNYKVVANRSTCWGQPVNPLASSLGLVN